jgi:hypothetical protein
MKKPVLILGAVAAFIALLTALTLSGRKVKIEVCMNYQGRQACKVASGADQQAALRTAVDNACADIAFGMAQSTECSNTRPTSARILP